jgi:hypothetical protein
VRSACPRCELVDVDAHAVAPSGTWELGIVALGAVLVTLALAIALKLLLRPEERAENHIKRAILEDEP